VLYEMSRSQREFVPDRRAHRFDANLSVLAGSVVGLQLPPGSTIGVRPETHGGSLERFFRPSHGDERLLRLSGTNEGDVELLLRVEYMPGERPTLPKRWQTTGPHPARLPSGYERVRRRIGTYERRPVWLALVELPNRVVIDMFHGERRHTRVAVPHLRPGGRVVRFSFPRKIKEKGLGQLTIAYVNENSARIFEHVYFFSATPRPQRSLHLGFAY
jgi:hypothetical protein